MVRPHDGRHVGSSNCLHDVARHETLAHLTQEPVSIALAGCSLPPGLSPLNLPSGFYQNVNNTAFVWNW